MALAEDSLFTRLETIIVRELWVIIGWLQLAEVDFEWKVELLEAIVAGNHTILTLACNAIAVLLGMDCVAISSRQDTVDGVLDGGGSHVDTEKEG